MCLEERNTDRRGRPAFFTSVPRTRRLRRSNWFILPSMATASLLLAFLAMDVLAPIADALALIGLGRARGADLGGELAHLLLVDAGDLDDLLLGAGDLHLHARRDLVQDVMAEADLQLQAVLAFHRRPEAHAVDLQRMRVALGDAFDEVEDLRTRHAPHGLRLLGLLPRLDSDTVGRLLDRDLLGAREGELALGARHLHRLPCHRRGDAGRYRDRISADA